jgi:hypothetical protein
MTSASPLLPSTTKTTTTRQRNHILPHDVILPSFNTTQSPIQQHIKRFTELHQFIDEWCADLPSIIEEDVDDSIRHPVINENEGEFHSHHSKVELKETAEELAAAMEQMYSAPESPKPSSPPPATATATRVIFYMYGLVTCALILHCIAHFAFQMDKRWLDGSLIMTYLTLLTLYPMPTREYDTLILSVVVVYLGMFMNISLFT